MSEISSFCVTTGKSLILMYLNDYCKKKVGHITHYY